MSDYELKDLLQWKGSPLGMEKNIFAPKRNEVLIAVQAQINKIAFTQKLFIALESILLAVSLYGVFYLML